MECIRRRAAQMIKDLEGTKNYEEHLNLFSLETRRPQGDMIADFMYLKGCHIEDGVELFRTVAENGNI